MLLVTLCLSSCESVKENALVVEKEEKPIKIVIKFDAKGDLITKMKQESTVDLENVSEDQIKQLEDSCSEYEKRYKKLGFVDYKFGVEDNVFKEKISFEATEENVKKLKEENLLPVSEDDNRIGLKATKEFFEKDGYKVVK